MCLPPLVDERWNVKDGETPASNFAQAICVLATSIFRERLECGIDMIAPELLL